MYRERIGNESDEGNEGKDGNEGNDNNGNEGSECSIGMKVMKAMKVKMASDSEPYLCTIHLKRSLGSDERTKVIAERWNSTETHSQRKRSIKSQFMQTRQKYENYLKLLQI